MCVKLVAYLFTNNKQNGSFMDSVTVGLFVEMIFSLVGGLGIFLVGMKNMSEGLQSVAGDRLRQMISVVTDNRLLGVGVGVFVTCLVQSSSVTTVMVVGLVNSGFMTLVQAIGVIFGANIGTTITGWILTLRIGKYGLPLLGVAAMFFLFSKREKVRYAGLAVMGIGMVFFGLELMSNGFRPLRDVEGFRAWFYAFEATSYPGVLKCMLVGCILTMIVQSSSATLGITMSLAMTGVIRFETAAALVVGENVGTTITAWLVSLGVSTTAKRAAYAHIIFNMIGAFWISLLFLPFYLPLIRNIMGHDPNFMEIRNGEPFYPYILAAIAAVHTGFNVINTMIFIPLLNPLARLVTWMVPDKGIKETPHLRYIDSRLVNTPELGIVQSRKEMLFMAQSVDQMMEWLEKYLFGDENLDEWRGKIFRREEVLDHVQQEVVGFLGQLVSGQISHTVMDRARRQLRLVDEYESLSDYIVVEAKGMAKLRKNNVTLKPDAIQDLKALHSRTAAYINMIRQVVENDDTGCMPAASAEGAEVTRLMKECRRRHLALLTAHDLSPIESTVYMDMLNYYRRMRDHAFNIAEIIAREK